MVFVVAFVTAPVKSAQSEKLPESSWDIVVQVQNPVFGAAERSGDPQIKFAEQFVLPLGEMTPESCEQIISFYGVFAEDKTYGETFDTDSIFPIAGPFKAICKGGEHFSVRETDAYLHGERRRLCKAAGQKGSKPPVPAAVAYAVVSFIAQQERTFQHFVLFRTGEPGAFVVLFRNDRICMIDTNLRTGIDTILAFPDFNQPGSAAIIEIDRKRVKDHLKTGRHIVIKPGVPCLFLPGVCCGREDAAVTMKTIAEWIHQFIYKRTFGTTVHTVDFTDDFLSTAVKEDTAQKGHE